MIVRQELALYNPEYCARPHVVALNKMDLDDAADLQQEVANDILAAAEAMQVSALRLEALLGAILVRRATARLQRELSAIVQLLLRQHRSFQPL